MIISRTIARRRIAAGVRPGWFGAWGLVLVDAVILMPVLAVVGSTVSRYFFGINPMHWAVIGSLIVTVFIPMQVVLITSALWAAKSRWEDNPQDKR
jgi:hypothetical protein